VAETEAAALNAGTPIETNGLSLMTISSDM
jgi:hypothetical protein